MAVAVVTMHHCSHVAMQWRPTQVAMTASSAGEVSMYRPLDDVCVCNDNININPHHVYIDCRDHGGASQLSWCRPLGVLLRVTMPPRKRR